MVDAGAADGGRPAPQPDAQVAYSSDPIRACNRSDPAACSSGETCDLLIRFAASASEPKVYTGCVPLVRERGPGDPCDPDPTNNVPVRLPHLIDDVYRDECGPGLVCAPSRAVRNGFNCQSVCSTNETAPQACSSPTATCMPATSFSEYCRESERCDAVRQTGCLPGEACFLSWSDDKRRLLTLCSAPVAMPDALGSATCNPLTCEPGSACLGPVHKPISRWTRADVKCRLLCSGMTANDITGDEDAGVETRLCPNSTTCEPFSESGLLLSSIPNPPYGQCEAPPSAADAGTNMNDGATGICTNGSVRNSACGLNGAGNQQQTCFTDTWITTGTCVDPDVCKNTSVRAVVCGLNGNGTQSQTCSSGQWQASACVDPDVCVNSATGTAKCGLNSRGIQPAFCSLGAWVATGSCSDPDVCKDGESQYVSCPGGAYRCSYRQVCRVGTWREDYVMSCFPCPY